MPFLHCFISDTGAKKKVKPCRTEKCCIAKGGKCKNKSKPAPAGYKKFGKCSKCSKSKLCYIPKLPPATNSPSMTGPPQPQPTNSTTAELCATKRCCTKKKGICKKKLKPAPSGYKKFGTCSGSKICYIPKLPPATISPSMIGPSQPQPTKTKTKTITTTTPLATTATST